MEANGVQIHNKQKRQKKKKPASQWMRNQRLAFLRYAAMSSTMGFSFPPCTSFFPLTRTKAGAGGHGDMVSQWTTNLKRNNFNSKKYVNVGIGNHRIRAGGKNLGQIFPRRCWRCLAARQSPWCASPWWIRPPRSACHGVPCIWCSPTSTHYWIARRGPLSTAAGFHLPGGGGCKRNSCQDSRPQEVLSRLQASLGNPWP